MDFEVGHVLGGKYRIERRIGVGGMGSVYEAKHAGLGTAVAIKVLLPQLAKAPTVADRFRREAQVAATLKSPHVIQVTDVDQLADGRPYLVMELLEGEALQEHLDRSKALSREEAVDIGLQILLGLEHAHAQGVVHRDLKPGNIFLDVRGVGRIAKILDFGVAKVRATPEFQALTRPGMVMGTPEYMAPEQAFSADQADARSDLYSVGVMLYEMLSGALPAPGSAPMEVAHQVMTNQVRPLRELCPGLPQGLINLVHRAMQPDRGSRFETALDMRRALSAFAGELSIAGRVAASVALGERPPSVASGPAGTEKVVAMEPIRVGAAVAAGAVIAARPAPVPAAPPAAVSSGAAPAARATVNALPARGLPDGTGEMSEYRGPLPRGAAEPLVAPAPMAGSAMPSGGLPSGPSPGTSGSRGDASPQAAALAGAKPLSRTVEMPEMASRVPPTLPTPDRPPAPRRRLGRALGLMLLWAGVLGGAGVGVAWVLSQAGVLRLYPDPGPPPPMPQPQTGAQRPVRTAPASTSRP